MDVGSQPLPFCDEDEDEEEVFFGRLSGKEQLKAVKFEDRRTALFVQGFRSDRKLMRCTIEMRRSQQGIGAGDENGTNHSLGETLSAISEENGDHGMSCGDHVGLKVDKCRFGSETGNSETDFHLKHNSPVTVDSACDSVIMDVSGDDCHENGDLVTGNGDVHDVSEWDGNSSRLLHFFANVCALEPHIEDCGSNVKDDIVVLEKAIRDNESDANGNSDRVTVDEMSSSDSDDTSYDTADDMTDDSWCDEEGDTSGMSESDGLTGDTIECVVASEESHDINGDVDDASEQDASPCVGDTDKSDLPNVGRGQDNCDNSPSGVRTDADSHGLTHNCQTDCGVNENVIETNECDLPHESFNSDEEITFKSDAGVKTVENGEPCETSEVTIACEISRLELITESSMSVNSTTVSDAAPHINVVCVINGVIKCEQSVDCVASERLSIDSGFTTPGVALQRIHDAGCSAFKVYRSEGVAKSEPGWCQESDRNCINVCKEVSVKLDFDGVTVKTENDETSDVSMAIADPAMSFVCDTPDISNAFSHDSDVDNSTPTFIPPTPHISTTLKHLPVHGCHGDSTVSDQYIASPEATDGRCVTDHTVSACSQSNHSIASFPPVDQSVVKDEEVSHMNLSTPGSYSRQPISSRTFTPTVLQESPMSAAMATGRNRVASPSVVFTEQHFSPTVSLRHFRDETPIGGNVRPTVMVCDDDDVVPPTPSVSQLSHHSVVFTEKYYSPTCVGSVDEVTPTSCDVINEAASPFVSSTSQESPRIIFTEKNFSPVVIKLSREPSCRKTRGSTVCDRGATPPTGDAVSSPCVNHKGNPQQRVNKLKLKKTSPTKKAPLSSPRRHKRTPKKSRPDGATLTPIRSKLRIRPSPLVVPVPVLLRRPTKEVKSRPKLRKGGDDSTPSHEPPVYRRGTPGRDLVTPRSTRRQSPWVERTPGSSGRRTEKETEIDSGEVFRKRRARLLEVHHGSTDGKKKLPSPWNAAQSSFSPGPVKLLCTTAMSPAPPTSASNLPRVRYKEKALNQVQLDAITQLHTLCNSQQATRYITRPRVGGPVKRVPGKVCSRLSWHDDTLSRVVPDATLSRVPDDSHAPPSLDQTASHKSILRVKPMSELYPFSSEPLSPVVIRKAVKKTNTLAQAANKS